MRPVASDQRQQAQSFIDLSPVIHSQYNNPGLANLIHKSVIANSQRPLSLQRPDEGFSDSRISRERLDLRHNLPKEGWLSSVQAIKVFGCPVSELNCQQRTLRFGDRCFC